MPEAATLRLAERAPASLRLLATVLLVLGAAAQAWFGVRPGLSLPGGDFANYYTAARIALAREDLTPAYTDFLWFQQQMDAAGFVGQLGSFVPHPPATALVMAPLAGLDPLPAKRAWTAIDVALAVTCAIVIGRLAGIGGLGGGLAIVATGAALANDLAFGQLYLLVLLSLSVGLLLVSRGSRAWGGVALGLLLPVKPFAVPLLAYFVLKRDWRVVAGALAGAAVVTAVSVPGLGWPLHERFVTVVLPRLASGELQDPFHPYWQSFASLARRMFLTEPTLNAMPALAAPRLAGALPAVAAVAGWGAVTLAVRSAPDAPRLHWATIVAASLALAPGGATYHLVLLALPFALIAGEALRSEAVRPAATAAVAIAAGLALPLPAFMRRFDGGWSTPLAYPRLWLLVALVVVLLVALARVAREPVGRTALAAVGAVALLVGVAGALRERTAPSDGASPVAIVAPELSGPDRTIAARPTMRAGRLAFLAADPATGRYELFTPERKIGRAPIGEAAEGALSPDRRRLAFVAERRGNVDVYLRSLDTGVETRLTFDPAIDREPCWESPTSLVFSSDRGRGLAYTTIYRIPVPEEPSE
jgi:hypothetical protein